MKITLEMHDTVQTVEWPDRPVVPLAEAIQSFCRLLEGSGWSRDSIIELFGSERFDENSPKNNPFEWEVHQ